MTGHDTPDFRVLGPLEVRQRPIRASAASGSERCSCSLLLRASEAVSRDRLIDDLWGAEPPATAANALAALVARAPSGSSGLLLADAGGVRAEDRARFAGPSSIRAARGGRWECWQQRAEPSSRAPALRAVSVARPGPRGLRIRSVCAARDRPARGATARCAREQDRRRSRSVGTWSSWASCKDCSSSTRCGSACGPADARALSIRPAGRALEAYRDGRQVFVEELGIDPGPALQELEGRSSVRIRSSAEGTPRAGSAAFSACDSRRRRRRRDARCTARGGRAARRALGARLILIVLEQDDERLSDAARLAHERMESLAENGRAVRAAAFVTTTPGDDVVRVAAEQNVDLVVVDPLGDIGAGLSDATWQPCSRAPCDVGVLVAGTPAAVGPGRAVIVPFGGAEHEWAALRSARGLRARLEHDSSFGTAADPDAGQRDASRLLATASLVLQQAAGVTAEPRLAPRGPEPRSKRSRRRCHSGRATGSLASARPRRRPACPRDAVAVTRAARTRGGAAWRPRPGPEPHSLHVDDRSS